MSEAGLRPAPADGAVLRDVLARGVDEGTDRPGPGVWIRDAFLEGADRLASWIEAHLGFFEGLRADVLVWGLRVLFLSLLAILGLAALRWLWRRRPGPSAGDGRVEPTVASTAAAGSVDRERELASLLARGDASSALAVLWWWLADALGTTADPAWTSRELIGRARRPDLRPAVRRLDRFAHGGAPPSVEEVRRLWADLREALDPPSGVAAPGAP